MVAPPTGKGKAMAQRITFITSYDAKPTTKQFAETAHGSRQAEMLWNDLEGPSKRFVLFAVWWKDGSGVWMKLDRAGAEAGR